MSIVDLALLFCPREFRDGYRRDVRHASSADALNLAWTGIALRCETVARDIGFAARSLVKAPLFTIVALVTLALAISVNAVAFGAINAILLKPLPFVDPSQLVFLCSPYSCDQTDGSFMQVFQRESKTLQDVAGFQYFPTTLTVHGVPQALQAYASSENVFSVLKVRPEIGRFFVPGHSFGEVVISDYLWRTAFNKTPHITQRLITLDGRRWRVAGVAPPQTVMPVPGGPPLPAKTLWFAIPHVMLAQPPGTINNWTFARALPGVSMGAVQSDVQRVTSQIVRKYPIQEKGLRLRAAPFGSIYFTDARRFLLLTLVAVFAVLLIACANVSNLLLVRGMARSGDTAVRNALGAGRRRIVQQAAIEIVLLAASGGCVGLLLALAEVRGLVAIGTQSVFPGVENIAIDARVIAFTFAVVALAAVLAGVVPALMSTRHNVAAALKPSGRGGDKSGAKSFREALAVVQVALAFAVIIASGLAYRSFLQQATANTGIDTQNVYWATASLYGRRYDSIHRGARARFMNAVLSRLSALPGVESAALVRPNPYLAPKLGLEADHFRMPGRSYVTGTEPFAMVTQITPRYFDLLRVPVIAGRAFTDDDNAASARVAIVDQHFAQKYFAARNPIGAQILIPPINPLDSTVGYTSATIVGIVRNIPVFGTPDGPRLYVAQSQFSSRAVEILIRMRTRDPQLRAHVAQTVASIDPLEPIYEFGSLQGYIDEHYIGPRRMSAVLIGFIAVIALSLALAGIYALLAYSVEQRRHEIGVRMAIGAKPPAILTDVFAGALRIGLAGIALGIVFAAVALRFFFGEDTADPVTFAAVVVVLLISVILASSLPAVRAMRMDPAVTLRYE
jgi:putative ABC transport system permease protein